jgi:transcriptional regulator with GAF, ATPase, and Fis domain
MKNRQSRGRAFLDLRNSEKYLRAAGAEIELARTWVALGDAYLREGEIAVAQSHLKKAWELFSRVGRELFPKDLALIMMPPEEKMEFMIDRIIQINKSLGTIRDRSAFLERMISLVMGFTMAVRGAFFVMESGRPKIITGRNLDPLMLKAGQFELITGVVTHVSGENCEAVMPGLREMSGLSDQSFLNAGISSFICMPASVDDEMLGYLYLDNRLSGPFPENQLAFIRLLCSQIAVGLSSINNYEDMRELKNRFEDEATFYKQEMGVVTPIEMIVGKSGGIEMVKDGIRQVAPTDSSVLILGETGVGKELVAKAIHNLSTRKEGPFIPVNLAALPQELVASELFGHEKGAFTGANEQKKGRFELAGGGTIFLDEIGDLPLSIQVKLLRVLQEGTFERLGSAKPIRSDFRVIAATHKDLRREIEKGAFRQDLFYRLDVFPIAIPPLRERKEDIPLLACYFMENFCRKMGKRISRIPVEELKKLTGYYWPGNVRELEHFVERGVILSHGDRIAFSGMEEGHDPGADRAEPSSAALADVERDHILKTLAVTRWRVSGPHGAAAVLGLHPSTLLSRMKKLGITRTVETRR